MADEPPQLSQRTILAFIIGGLVLWAIYIAVGAYLYNFSIARALVVLFCMAMFLGVWLLLLWTQGPRKRE